MRWLKVVLVLCLVSTVIYSFSADRTYSEKEIESFQKHKEYDYYKLKQLKPEQKKNQNSNVNSGTYNWGNGLGEILKWLFIAIFVLVLIFALISLLGEGSFSKKYLKQTKVKVEPIIKRIDEEKIEKNDFNALIESAFSEGDLRLVIRLRFLQVLQLMDSKQLITYRKSKTNIDYFYEIQNFELRKSFDQSSLLFEWVWYGNEKIGDQEYHYALPKLESLKNQVLGEN